MIHSRSSLLALLLGLALFAGSAHAQQSKPKTQNAETAALREKAFSLLESVAGQLGTLQSAENRARLGANIADSLWPHNEKQARELLQLVENDIRAEIQKWDPESGNNASLLIFLKLRADTVERIAKHDGMAALAFLKATKPPSSDDLPKYAHQDMENFETRLAYKVAGDNPEAALILGQEALAQGFSYELINLLKRLNRKHREPAQVLFQDMVKKLERTDLLTDWSARYFAHSLVQSFRPPAANESTFRSLIAIFVNTALKNGCATKPSEENANSQFCVWLASEVPDLEKFDARAARLRHWSSNNAQDFTPDPAYIQELSDLLEEGTTEQIVALVSKHPEIAEQTYWHLIDRARVAGDLEEARKITTTYISDPERRQKILAQLDNYEKTVTIDDATLERTEEIRKTIKQPSAQAWFLLNQAHLYGARDRKVALKLLDQASDIIATLKPDKEQTGTQIALAMFHCYEKSERGMEMMQAIVPRLNELVDLAARLDGYETGYLRDGEWNMSANGPIGEILTRLSDLAGFFAWCDFDRAVSLSSQFDRPEIRMMAHVKLARAILAGPPKRLAVYNNDY